MRLLVHGASVAADARMGRSLAGLARRGHRLGWVGGVPPRPEPDLLVLSEREVANRVWDLVVGAGGPSPVASLGRRGAVRAMVLSPGASALQSASWFDRMAWEALHSVILIEESEADLARGGRHGVPLERFGLWPGPAGEGAADAASPETEVLERAGERALAGAAGPAPRAGLLVDRDGTLIEERGYLDDPEGVELLPGVAAALREARASGHPVAVISNQAGVGRGRFTLTRAYEVMAVLRRRLRLEGVELDAIHLCPHAPDAGCACRKPGTLLLERAVEDLHLHAAHSVMVGDKRLDAQAGQAAGMTGILVRTGYGGEEEGATREGPDPDLVLPDLASAVHWFLTREEARVIG